MQLPVEPPDHRELFSELAQRPDTIERVLAVAADPAPKGRYRHWHKLRFLQPPEGVTHEQWWLAIKWARRTLLKPLPLTDKEGRPFHIGMPDPLLEMLQCIDRDAGGRIEISEQVTNPATRDRYLVSSLIDEAITSSQLEGAATTYDAAKDMIRCGREPKDRSERMILNNYRTIKNVRQLKNQELTPDLVFSLQSMLTVDTLDDPDAAGRFRSEGENVRVWDARDGVLLHTPPPASQLPERMRRMCEFANGSLPQYFVHPVVRAVLLHFWLAYDHPFVDGNGRTARALFYWSMLRSGFWLCEFLSISSIVKNSPGQYMRAYLYSESDDNDATYFALFHLRVILLAIKALHSYLRKKMKELRDTEKLLRTMTDLNHRQIALLSHALRHPNADYSIYSHRNSHGVVYQTARMDLFGLAEKGFLEQRKLGRKYIFYPPEDLHERVTAYS